MPSRGHDDWAALARSRAAEKRQHAEGDPRTPRIGCPPSGKDRRPVTCTSLPMRRRRCDSRGNATRAAVLARHFARMVSEPSAGPCRFRAVVNHFNTSFDERFRREASSVFWDFPVNATRPSVADARVPPPHRGCRKGPCCLELPRWVTRRFRVDSPIRGGSAARVDEAKPWPCFHDRRPESPDSSSRWPPA